MDKAHRTTIEVRGYELDSYKHVNHAVYISYLEHARWKMLEDAGITLDRLDEWKRWPVIAQLEARYLRPTYIGQKLDIDTRVVENRRVGFGIEQKIFFEGTPVLEAKVGIVIVNEKGRPADIPSEFTRLWSEKNG